MSSIKNRLLSVDNMKCEGCEENIKKELSNLNGVAEVEANYKTKTVSVKYDILKVNLKNIESKMNKIGYYLRKNLLYRMKIGLIHFLEENEQDNLNSSSTMCCSNPTKILGKAERE
jgi:copper chaperone CopZ